MSSLSYDSEYHLLHFGSEAVLLYMGLFRENITPFKSLSKCIRYTITT